MKQSYSINKLLLLSFILVAIVPITFLGTRLYQASWDNAWREINEKHKVLAENLTAPILIFVRNHQTMLSMLAGEINTIDPTTQRKNLTLLKHALTEVSAFQALILLNASDQAIITVLPNGDIKYNTDAYTNHASYVDVIISEEPSVSGAVFSQIDNKPTVLISTPIFDRNEELVGVLIAELKISVLDELRKGIEFGRDGHSVIVDQAGYVIAHPNPEWMAKIHNLSSADIIQKMMSRQTGVTEFYSPWRKEQMVAGYTYVPEIIWGVMVPQPKIEVEQQVFSLLYSQLNWALIGLAMAIFLAIILARWITKPLMKLAYNAKNLIDNNYDGYLPDTSKNAPNEVMQLDKALRELIQGLLLSRNEINSLNKNLQKRVDEATEQLVTTNKQLNVALEQRNEFISFARHDLRKPIAVINDITDALNTDQLGDNLSSESLQSSLNLIMKTAQYMDNIVNDFLGGEAIEQGLLNLHKEPTDINTIVTLMTKTNQAYANRKGIALKLELDKNLELKDIDGARISQVCQNLIDNAIKFCEPGCIIRIITRQLDTNVIVEIMDNGPGLSDRDLELIFTKNAHLSNRPTGGELSTGTGLTICKQIIKLHDGEIGVKNNEQQGCCFWFKL